MIGTKCKILVFILFFGVTEFIIAQTISVPYFCGFEDEAENSEWKMMQGPKAEECQDEWMISNIDYNEGYKSMTISCDSVSATFGAMRDLVVAYRKIKLDTSITVNISFDWKCEGIEDVAQCNFYFFPVGAIDESDLYSLPTSSLPNRLSRPTISLYGSSDWQTCLALSQVGLDANAEYYMVFAWHNTNTDTAQTVLSKYSVSIDNIQITSSSCPEPENLRYESACDTLFISWDGYTELYEFQYKSCGEKGWKTLPPTNEKSIVLAGIQEGAYDIRVRGVQESTNEQSAWCALYEVVCFCPDRHCINYVELDRPGVFCQWGEASNPDAMILDDTGMGDSGAGPYDFGSRDVRSRHTVNWKQNETDPRTGNKLKTIPNGALASVRLGNWNNGKQAEGIIFDYTVDTTQADIILMKYAVVLEKPNHGYAEDPYFGLEIFDENYITIDPICGKFSFSPMEDNGWNYHGNFVWKEWTSIGLNLSEYHNQTIKIMLKTQDCVRGAHCGYAYFTLDCVDASITSTSCGETVEMEMHAPDGFDYIWTRGEDREFVADTSVINIPADDIETYYCEVKYEDVQGCGFELHTEVKPRFPYADFDWEWKPENCENKILLKNKSCVHTRIDGVDTPTSEKCERFMWKIKDVDGEYEYIAEDVEYSVPKGGGEITVTLTSWISTCDSTMTKVINIDSIYEHYKEIYDTICEGDVYDFAGGKYAEAGEFISIEKNIWGCDSTIVLHLEVVSAPDEVYIYDTICGGDVYKFRDNEVSTAGEHRFTYLNDFGCDSIFILNLSVIEPLGISLLEDNLFCCAEDRSLKIGYESIDGMRLPIEYSIVFDAMGNQAGFENSSNISLDENNYINISIPENCRPNRYKATLNFSDTAGVCGDISISIEFEVYYSSNILQPKFNNLITVLDESANGGYVFDDTTYRWYKNNELIDSVNSFYYLPEGEIFMDGDCYYLEVKRVDDGVVTRTCEICPGVNTAIDGVDIERDDVLPITLFDKNQRIVLKDLSDGEVMIYTLTGQLLSSYDLETSDSIITAPSYSGIYVLRIVTPYSNMSYKIQVR